MNGVGRQGQRSSVAVVHHPRQYSNNFLETSSNGRWLQSPDLIDHGFYGGGGGGPPSRVYQNAQRGYNEFYVEALSTPPYNAMRSRVSREPEEEEIGWRWETSLRDQRRSQRLEASSTTCCEERRCCRRDERMRCCSQRRREAWIGFFRV
ncbi:hypothetical protein DVH24_016323 [Malus domestica]|uniref:Uncharacterized protein n=1 Tax=Malus domestica TaxID=3750 RepID=A0A498HWF8_MALDO|nr:hypothetical protein DVH24_016323 [Malus domestica]